MPHKHGPADLLRSVLPQFFPAHWLADAPGEPELFLGESEDNFTSARIPLPDVQRRFAQHLGPEYYTAIPCRDWFVCWSRDQTDEWKARNIASARQTFSDDEYNLSPDVFLVSDGHFSIYLSQDVDA